MRGAIRSPEAVAAAAVLKGLERYGPDGAECFPRAITFSDIDGVVELEGHLLFLEAKRVGEVVPHGQAKMYQALARVGTVFVKWLRPDGSVAAGCHVQENAEIAPLMVSEANVAEFFLEWAYWVAPYWRAQRAHMLATYGRANVRGCATP